MALDRLTSVRLANLREVGSNDPRVMVDTALAILEIDSVDSAASIEHI